MTDTSSKEKQKWWQETAIQTAFITGVITLFGIFVVRDTTRTTQENEQRKEYIEVYTKHLDNATKRKQEMKEKKETYYQLKLKNKTCPNSVYVAINYISLDDMSVTKGWIEVKPNQEISTATITGIDSLSIYAKTDLDKNAKTDFNRYVEWKPEDPLTHELKTYIIEPRNHNLPNDFNYINILFIDSDIQQSFINSDKTDNEIQQKSFYAVKLVSPKPDSYTTKVFDCDNSNTLKLTDDTAVSPQ